MPPLPKKLHPKSEKKKHGKSKVRHLFLLDLFLKFKSLQKTSCSLNMILAIPMCCSPANDIA